MDTKSEEVVALAHYLQYMGVYDGDPASGANVLVESALIEDAVVFFAKMLKTTNRFPGKPLFCDENEAWEHGQSVVNIMKTVLKTTIYYKSIVKRKLFCRVTIKV